jgi:hypothetical protein
VLVPFTITLPGKVTLFPETVHSVRRIDTEKTTSSPLSCSGELWQIFKDENDERWAEIGQGIHQCSVRAESKTGRKILSRCKLHRRCTVTVKLAPRAGGDA